MTQQDFNQGNGSDSRTSFNQIIEKVREKISELEGERGSTCILFYCLGSINFQKAIEFLNIIRKEQKIEKLDLILESGGGNIDDAVKIANLCKDFSTNFTVIIPYYAKSAATLIALYADELILCKAGELGPIDPQVRHPLMDVFIPASSIKRALDFIESSSDPYIKMTMADKLDPLLIGAYNQAIEEAKNYLEEVPRVKIADNKAEIIKTFTEKYIDHGYPITHRICEELKLCAKDAINISLENLLYDIHEVLIKYMVSKDIEIIILTKNQIHCRKEQTSERIEEH